MYYHGSRFLHAGTSGLFTNERRWKDDAVFEALGTTDELNSSVGYAFCVVGTYFDIQCCLQDVASNVATPHSSAKKAHLDLLDYWIDLYANRIPPLTKFILPGGNLLSSCLHQARCICRRAERTFTPLIRAEEVDPVVLQYLIVGR
ncbi:unnamed protein product [Soboliphyme baturini]|uniref:Corrinoid adenosyltransferase n=1 Tax=Soboliphyme baturini TaxID=241478 RepID=A0A183ILN0_9BILA|nr:unnamed protein product [Soboliphyme baturini]